VECIDFTICRSDTLDMVYFIFPKLSLSASMIMMMMMMIITIIVVFDWRSKHLYFCFTNHERVWARKSYSIPTNFSWRRRMPSINTYTPFTKILTPKLPLFTFSVTRSLTISTSSLVVLKSSSVKPFCSPLPSQTSNLPNSPARMIYIS
jgi:hypothetical protein